VGYPIDGTLSWRAGHGPFEIMGLLCLGIPAPPPTGSVPVKWIAEYGGVIQGGFVAAMLDDTMGPALVATLGVGQFAPTTDLHVQFLRPARPGRLIGRGRVVRSGKDAAFLAGELADDSGQIVAVATAAAAIRATRP
jgi:uncharacterized protein (TIGR00369 family)